MEDKPKGCDSYPSTKKEEAKWDELPEVQFIKEDEVKVVQEDPKLTSLSTEPLTLELSERVTEMVKKEVDKRDGSSGSEKRDEARITEARDNILVKSGPSFVDHPSELTPM